MEEITTLVATLVLPAILTAVPICYVVNVAKDRQRPLRSAVDTAQTLVARWAVWFALLLVAVFGLLESIDRWGVGVVLVLLLGPFAVLGVVLAVVMIWRERRRATVGPESSPAMSGTEAQGGQPMSTVFYSWQSDLFETRNVIEVALERAIRNLNRDLPAENALELDQDTRGVAGWPEITSALFDKIDQCEVFVADITPINGPTSDFRITPNPNVLLELGYALATGFGRTRIICVINTHYLPDRDLGKLPFDLRGSRPVQFTLEDPARRGVESGQEDPIRTTVRRDLAGQSPTLTARSDPSNPRGAR